MKIEIPTRQEILRLLGGARHIPFSPNFISVEENPAVSRQEFDETLDYRVTPDVFLKKDPASNALVQTIPLSVAFVDSEAQKRYFDGRPIISGRDREARKLHEAGFIDRADSKKSRLESIRESFPQNPTFNAIYLFPTDVCNLKCVYCNVEENKPKDSKGSFMDIGTAKRAIDLFFENLRASPELFDTRKPKYIAFYGGEALGNRKILNESINYARRRMSETGVGVDLCLMTNGTLMDDEEARFLGDNNVNVTISFDGLPRHHNQTRMFKGNVGSFERTLRGFEHVRDRCKTAVLCTVGDHNVEDLEEIAHYFADNLKPTAVEFNMVRNIRFGLSPVGIKSLDDAFERIYGAHKVLAAKGIADNNFSRRILAFADKVVYSRDLTRCGDIFYVSPKGKIYMCDSHLGMRAETELSVGSSLEDIKANHYVQEWFKRQPFNMPECGGCNAISICGGGCPYNAAVTSGSMHNKDEQACRLNGFVLNRIIRDISEMKRG
jgi:uncharacterized protein